MPNSLAKRGSRDAQAGACNNNGGSLAWLRELLIWPLAGLYLSGSDIDQLALIAAEDSSASDAALVIEPNLAVIAARPPHWRWLGIALLAGSTKGSSIGRGARRIGAPAIRKLLNEPFSATAASNNVIAWIDAQLLAGETPHRIDLTKTSVRLKSWQSDALRYALALLAPAETKLSSVAAAKVRPPAGPTSPHRASPQAFSPFLDSRKKLPDLPLEDLRELPRAVSIPDDGDDGVSDSKNVSRSLIYENWLAEHCTSLHLAGALIPGTDRSFTRPEVLSLAGCLEEVLTRTRSDQILQICALAYLLCLMTGRPRQAALGAMAKLAAGKLDDANKTAWLRAKAFRVQVPVAREFGKVNPDAQFAYCPCRQSLWLPLPVILSQTLGVLHTFDEDMWRFTSHGWDIHFERLKAHLLPKVPRFSEIRLRHVLPVAVWTSTADIVNAQIITGDLLDHPSAALHYYAQPAHEIEATYLAAVATWIPSRWTFSPSEMSAKEANALVGAPRAAIADATIKAAIVALTARCKRSFQDLKGGLEGMINAYSDAVTLTAALFTEATANRLTFHLGLLTLRDFVLPDRKSLRAADGEAKAGGLVVFTDKHTTTGQGYRVAAIPIIVVRQIYVLLDITAHLEARFATILGGSKTATALRRIYGGERALFQRIETRIDDADVARYRLFRVKRRDLQKGWVELPIPVEHLRHRFTTLASRNAMAPADARLQMGHSMDFVPFGLTDPDSPLDFVQRVAPSLEVGLRAEGWEVIGEGLFKPAPALEPLAPSTVCKLDTLFVARSERRGKQFAQMVTSEAQLYRQAIQKEVAELANDRDDVIVPICLSDINIRTIEERLRKRFLDSGRWPAASCAFRSWLRQQPNTARSGTYLPPVAFYAQPRHSPISPALPRAFHAAGVLLDQAERLDTASAALHQDGLSAVPTIMQLAALVIELSIRGGLTERHRLLAGVIGLENVQPYGDEIDHVVIDLVDIGEESTPEHRLQIASHRHARVPEGVVLAGETALLALSWMGRFRHIARSITLQSLSAAASSLLPADGKKQPERQAMDLDQILRTAALARRVTVSGIRSAWEERRLASRAFGSERENRLRSGRWVAPPPPEATAPCEEHRSEQQKRVHGGDDANLIRQMRKVLRSISRPNKSGGTHEQIAQRFERELKSAVDCGGTAAAFVTLVSRWLRSNLFPRRRRASTVYTYLTVLATPVLNILACRDLLKIDADELEELVLELVMSKRATNRRRTLLVVGHLLDVVAELGGAHLDENPLTEWAAGLDADYITPYCLTLAEQNHAKTQLRHWHSEFASDRAGAWSDRLPSHDINAALGFLVLACMGLRAGESRSRRKTDLVSTAEGSVLLVRPRRLSPLKTLASHRALLVDDHIDVTDLETLKLFFEAMNESVNDIASPENAMLIASNALGIVADSISARLHACRHTLGCFGYLAINENHRSGGVIHRGISEARWLAPFKHHPAAIQMLVLARILGHATPITTLNHYIHLIAYDVRHGRGWRAPDGRGFATLSLLACGTLRTRLSRAGKAATTLTAAEMISELRYSLARGQPVEELAFVPVDAPQTISKQKRKNYSALGQLLLDISAGSSSASLIARHAVLPDRLDEIVEEILTLQEHYRHYMLSRTDAGKVVCSMPIPAWSSLKEFLARCDCFASESPIEWNSFIEVLRRQTQLTGELRVSRKGNPSLTQKVFSEILGSEAEANVKDGYLVLMHSTKFDRGAVKGTIRAPITFVCFVLLLADRLWM